MQIFLHELQNIVSKLSERYPFEQKLEIFFEQDSLYIIPKNEWPDKIIIANPEEP